MVAVTYWTEALVPVQYDKLEKERMAGIVPSGQVTGFFYRFTKGPFYKIFYEFRIETADLFSGELGFIPDQLVYRHIKKSGKLEQKHQIRRTLGILPLGYGCLGHSQKIRQFLLRDLPLMPEPDNIVR